MWPVKAGGDEERFVAMSLDQFDGFRRDLAVGLFFVGPFGLEHGHRTSQSAHRREIGDLRLFILITTAWIDYLLPRWGIVQTIGADVAGIAVVINLAHARGEVTVLHEQLWNRDDLREPVSKMIRQVEYLG